MLFLGGLLLLGALPARAAKSGFPLPSPEVRAAIIETLKSEVERVDGDALLPRGTRPESWEATIAGLKDEAASAKTQEEFGRVLHRFDATIPNHHVHGFIPVALEPYTAPPFPFTARPESLVGESPAQVWRLAAVSTASWSGADAPAAGDELTSINGRPMSSWSDENFTFCKSPLRSQCEQELFENLDRQVLSWSYPQPLTLGLRRGARTWEAAAPMKVPASWPSERDAGASAPLCGVEAGRYPGFTPAYVGVHACVFESAAQPGVFVLRIPSFAYEHGEEQGIDPVEKEVRQLYDGFWKDRAEGIRTLIVDVLDNHGGSEPTPYYKLLFDAPFQEQYVQYRKLAELEGDSEPSKRLWSSVLWGEKGKEDWLAGLRRDGRWDKVPTGGFLPPVPQFCAEEVDCEHSLFTPLPHQFTGRVKVLINRLCISSCVGFVYDLVDVFGGRARTYGEPDSGDSTYSRLFLDVFLDAKDPRGFRTRLSPYDGRGARNLGEAFYRLIVSVTRSTDAHGRVISGIPQKIDVPLLPRWDEAPEGWAARVFAEALK